MQNRDFPYFSCTVVFVDEKGKEVTQTDFPTLQKFFLAWKEGELKRRVKIVEKEDGVLNSYFKKVENDTRAALLSLTFNLQECYDWLNVHLGLSNHILAYQKIEMGAHARVRIPKNDLVFFAAPGDSAESAAKVGFVFVPSLPIEFNFERKRGEFKDNPKKVVEEFLNEMVKETIAKDNATVVFLLKQGAQDTVLCEQFSPASFNTIRHKLWEKQIPAPTLLTTPAVLAFIVEEAQWFYPDNKSNWATGQVGKFGDVSIICGGSEKDEFGCGLDFTDYFMFGPPQKVGVRTEKIPIEIESIDKSILGVSLMGWSLYGSRGTLIFGSGISHAKIG